MRSTPDGEDLMPRYVIENCEFEMGFECPKTFQSLGTTDSPEVRTCDQCHRNVHFCNTITELREHVEAGHCVAFLSKGNPGKEDIRVGRVN